MRIAVNERLHLGEYRASDRPALLQHLNERDIYERTLRIPFPYTDAAADEWLALVDRVSRQQGRGTQWAIRTAEDALIGGCGFEGLGVGKSHRAEIGYWLAKPYWGQGIMTAVVRAVCRYGFEEMGLLKITAQVFAANPASARVLEKCGFQQEGFLRRHFLKDAMLLDARLFGLLREEAPQEREA